VVSACVLTDVVPDDPRPGVLHEVGLAGMVVGDTAPDWGLAAVHTDGYGQMRDLMRLVVDLGHRRVGRVSGPGELVHTQIRDRAFDESVGELGLTGARVEGDYTAEGGADATRLLLAGDQPPTLIVYDNDVMAVAGLAVAQERGVDVPDELSIVAWDDSVHCRLSIPPIGAMNHDARGSGELAGAILVELLGGGTPRDVATPAPLWVPRSSVRSLPAPVQG
jgi:DNA-binding LacI/PurR family transcriptional regulator